MTDYDHTITQLNGLSIAEQILGTGDAIVFLHGWGAHIGLLQPLAQRVAAAGFTCYQLDLPGFGHSDEPPQAWTVYDYADFVLAYLDEHELERVHLFGHSFGGRLSLILAAKHPERVHKLVLSDAAGIRAATPLWARLRLKSYKAIRDSLYSIGLSSLADYLRERYNVRYGSSDFQAISGIMRQTFVNVVNEDLLYLAPQIQASTLLFWGDHDQDTPLWMGQKLEQVIPDAGLIVHEGAGHYAYLDAMIETARVMDYFLKQD